MNSEKEDELVTQRRLIVMFDILGFKERVNNMSHEEIYNELLHLKNYLVLAGYSYKSVDDNHNPTTIEVTQTFHHLLFSDTIVLISDKISSDIFYKMIIESFMLITYCLKQNIPIKGCIAAGDISYSDEHKIIFGKPLIDAYLLSDQMKFMGLIIDKSCEKENIDFNEIGIINKCKVPLKSGTVTYNHINISLQGIKNYRQINPEKITIENIESMYKTTDAAARIYLDNTIDLYFKEGK